MLQSYEICREDDSSPGVQSRQYRFCIRRTGMPTLHLAADNEPTISKWLEVLANAVEESQIADAWLEQARRNLTLAPNAIPKPDCFGYLVKLGTQWKSWSRRYCVLKDACLYFYQDANSRSAFGTILCIHLCKFVFYDFVLDFRCGLFTWLQGSANCVGEQETCLRNPRSGTWAKAFLFSY